MVYFFKKEFQRDVIVGFVFSCDEHGGNSDEVNIIIG
jgi:hypothetical protein